ncbi:MAG: Panacea domain-containing protein [Bacteroidales bacterium]
MTANNIADYLLATYYSYEGDSDNISHLKLQKLLYYCQAWHLTAFGTPLFDDEIQAWAHGPAIRSVFDRFRGYQIYDIINTEGIKCTLELTENAKAIIDEVMEVYGKHTGRYLEALTHSEAPWIDARAGLEDCQAGNNIITHEAMISFYSKMLN